MLPFYLIPIKIRAPLNFARVIFAHSQILRPCNFRAPLSYYKVAVFHLFAGFFSPFNFCAFLLRELPNLIFAQAGCAKIKGAQTLMGIR